eukprot:Pgem_evm1s784
MNNENQNPNEYHSLASKTVLQSYQQQQQQQQQQQHTHPYPQYQQQQQQQQQQCISQNFNFANLPNFHFAIPTRGQYPNANYSIPPQTAMDKVAALNLNESEDVKEETQLQIGQHHPGNILEGNSLGSLRLPEATYPLFEGFPK